MNPMHLLGGVCVLTPAAQHAQTALRLSDLQNAQNMLLGGYGELGNIRQDFRYAAPEPRPCRCAYCNTKTTNSQDVKCAQCGAPF